MANQAEFDAANDKGQAILKAVTDFTATTQAATSKLVGLGIAVQPDATALLATVDAIAAAVPAATEAATAAQAAVDAEAAKVAANPPVA